MRNPRKPDFRVACKSLDGRRWFEIGAAWSEKAKDGTSFLYVKLNATPPAAGGGVLTIWPHDKKSIEIIDKDAAAPSDDDIPF